MARPRKPEGALVTVATRIPGPARDRLDEIAASKGLSRSALLARITASYIEAYPIEDVD